MRACLRRRVHTSCRTEKHIEPRQPLSSLHAARHASRLPGALSPVNPWLLGARGNGLCCIANWWSLVSCGDRGRHTFQSKHSICKCGKTTNSKRVSYIRLRNGMLSLHRVCLRNTGLRLNTHIYTLQLQAAVRHSPVLLRK